MNAPADFLKSRPWVLVPAERNIIHNEEGELPASSLSHSQILSRSYGGKSGEGLGSLIRHEPEMVDTVST